MLPYVILYNAVSLDGCITGFNADVELYYELASKWNIDAVLMGSNTILTGFNAKPGEIREGNIETLKTRKKDSEDSRPYLVVPDTKGQIRLWDQVFKMPYLRDVIVLCSGSTPEEYLDYLKERNIDYSINGEDQVDLSVALEKLNSEYGIKKIRVDSGGILNGALLSAGLVDEVQVLIHPELVGDSKSGSIFQLPDLNTLDETIKLKLVHIRKLNDDIIWMKYDLLK